jgi:hypothetical protein
MKNCLRLSLLAIAIAGSSSVMAAEPATSLSQAISGGKTTLNLRYRFEYVDQDGKDIAKASTLKTGLTFKTLDFKGASAVLEFNNNSEVLADDYNSKVNGKTQYAVIADPTYTDVNQAYLNYAAPLDTTVRVGRQRILLDNQRFVGGVGWRQNEQTYDAVTLMNTTLADTTITLSNVMHVNTILNTMKDGDDQIIHIKNSSLPAGSISVYGYLLKNASDTYGVRFDGSTNLDKFKLLYTAEYAKQKADNAAGNKANYYLAQLGAHVSGITAKVSYEVQSSDKGAYAFNTPLGTNHAFDGWADTFLTTPVKGLKDANLMVSTKLAGPKLAVVYHQFNADEGNDKYGDELDLVAVQPLGKNYKALLKFAKYNADTYGKDTQKAWLQLSAKF